MNVLHYIFLTVLAVISVNGSILATENNETTTMDLSTTEELDYAQKIQADPHPIKLNLEDPSDSGIFIERPTEFNFVKWMHYTGNLLVLTGPTGVGKSALARMYGQTYKGNVFWIDCQNTSTMLKSFKEIAEILDIPTNTKMSTLLYNVLAYFEHKKSLFIFDDAKPDNVVINSLKNLIGKSIHINLIITSSDPYWDKQYFEILKMEHFTKDEAVIYLRRALKNMKLPQNIETDTELELLADNLIYNPGALFKASKYIKHRYEDNEDYKIEHFIDELEKYLNPTKTVEVTEKDKTEDELPKIMTFLEDINKDIHIG